MVTIVFLEKQVSFCFEDTKINFRQQSFSLCVGSKKMLKKTWQKQMTAFPSHRPFVSFQLKKHCSSVFKCTQEHCVFSPT